MNSNDIYVIGTLVGFILTVGLVIVSPERAIPLAILTGAWFMQPWVKGD